MTLHPGIPLRREKGKPEGYAVTGNTRKPWVAEKGLVLYDAAGQNNSNLTLLTALVVNGEWELILVMSSHYCFITLQILNPLPIHIYTARYDNLCRDSQSGRLC
jgi:hypothetical protein